MKTLGIRAGRLAAVWVVVAWSALPVQAMTTTDEAAAMLIWPDIVAADADALGSFRGTTFDTIVTVSNTSNEPVELSCFYENANSHCANTGEVCFYADDCCNGFGCGVCEPGWIETDFRLFLTPRQPIGWEALEGRSIFPLTGEDGLEGPDGSTNELSRIPPVGESPFSGSLRCLAVNEDGSPSHRNVLRGDASKVAVGFSPSGRDEVTKHNAVGLRAIEGLLDGDKELRIGGPDPEYDGCASVLILNHFFDGGYNPAVADRTSRSFATRLVLVPCGTDYLRQVPGKSVVQFIVVNEFEQRFSTSRTVECKADLLLSSIDTNQPSRSIFSVGVTGTLAGQSRMSPIEGGLVGMATEATFGDFANLLPDLDNNLPVANHSGVVLFSTEAAALADYHLFEQGDREEADILVLP